MNHQAKVQTNLANYYESIGHLEKARLYGERAYAIVYAELRSLAARQLAGAGSQCTRVVAAQLDTAESSRH